MAQDSIKHVAQLPASRTQQHSTLLALVRKHWTDGVFVLPALILFTVFVIYPTLSSIYYSMTSWNGLDTNIQFTGLSNFKQLLSDPEVWVGIRTTLIFSFVIMIVQNLLALLLALAFDTFTRIRLFSAVRVLFLIPMLLSGLAIGYVWSYMYSPLFGVINALLSGVGLSGLTQDWLGNPHLALGSIIFTAMWQSVGFGMIIFLAGLQTIPPELYEAADVDGASGWQRFRSVTFPLIAPAFTINVVLTLIGSLKVFDVIFVMTGGGPGDATQSLLIYVYKQAFTDNNFGYAGAIALVASLIILLLSVTSLGILRKREVEY